MIILSTVWHTGTYSALETLRKQGKTSVYRIHCCDDALMKMREWSFEGIVTTYRDPLRVAASWANRGEDIDDRWYSQWKAYYEMMKRDDVEIIKSNEKLNSSPDKLKLHHYLDVGDMNSYYEHVPKEAIEFVYEQSKSA